MPDSGSLHHTDPVSELDVATGDQVKEDFSGLGRTSRYDPHQDQTGQTPRPTLFEDQPPEVPVEGEDDPIFPNRATEDFTIVGASHLLRDRQHVVSRISQQRDTHRRDVLVRQDPQSTARGLERVDRLLSQGLGRVGEHGT